MLSSGHGKSLGMAACTAIVVGNMVGSGFYLSPAAVAPYGNLAILIWLIMGAGAICLGLTFAKLARLVPATGGPYAYTRLAYGDFPGFLIAWGYWISIWASLPVIAVAFAGVVVDLFPAIRSRGVVVFITLAAIWAVVLINLRGVSTAGVFAEITTYAKLVPFGAIALLGIFFIDPSHFSEFNPSGVPLLQASAALAPLTMFAYLGLESATVPAGDVRDPERTIPRSTVLGIAIAAALYILGTVVVMGLVPRQQLVNSVAPFSDAARILWGRPGEIAISIAVVLSSIGALNGWTLLMGQVPMAAAQDRLLSSDFRREVSPGRASDRDRCFGAACDSARPCSGVRVWRIFSLLQPRRGIEHDGGSGSLRLLCSSAYPRWSACERRFASAAGNICRDCGIRVFHVHALWMRGRAGPLRVGFIAAGDSGVRLAAAANRRAGPVEASAVALGLLQLTTGSQG